MLTRRHFILIAAGLRGQKPGTKADQEKWEDDCKMIARELKKSNPEFNRNRFLDACGV